MPWWHSVLTMFLVCMGGRKQLRFTGILFFDKMTIESPMLPSPFSPQIHCHPERIHLSHLH
jgi:hypothetical protein